MTDNIKKYKDQFPVVAQSWIEKRLNQYNDRNKGLPDKEDINNVRDWVFGLQEQDPDFTENKLNKVSWDDAVVLQDKWHKRMVRLAKELFGYKGKPDEVTDYILFENGWRWVKLDTPEAMDFEGDAMGHCVGQGAYDDKIIYSLRDSKNMPHVTVEYDEESRTIEQIKGKGNTLVNKRYFFVVECFFEKLKPKHVDRFPYCIDTDDNWYVGNHVIQKLDEIPELIKKVSISGSYFPYAIGESGKWYLGTDAIINAPDDVVFRDVDLVSDKTITHWKHDVSGDFNAIDNGLETIDPDVKFTGDVSVCCCDNLKVWKHDVAGNFDARGSGLEKIEEGVKLGGYVSINDCKNITHWKHDVPGFFDAEKSGLETIDPNVKFGSNVNIDRCENIREWKHDVPGHFYADDSGLESVSPDVMFGGNVVIYKCENLKVWPCDIKGRLNACHSGLESIKEGVTIGGNMSVYKTPYYWNQLLKNKVTEKAEREQKVETLHAT